MRSEQPRTATMFQDVDLVRENVQSISVDNHWLFRTLYQIEDFGCVRFSQTGPKRPDVDLFFEQFAIGAKRLDHRFHGRGRGNDRVNFFRNENLHQSRACAQGPAGGHERSADKSFRTGHDADAAKLIFVGAEFPSWQKRAEGMSGGGEFLWRSYVRGKIGKWNDLDSANEVEREIGNQAVLGKTDRDREIGDDAILRIDFAGIGVQASGKIDRENKSVVRVAQSIDFAGGRADRFAKKPIGAETEQAIQNNIR